MHTWASLQRLFWGILFGGIPALVLGIAMGLNRADARAVRPADRGDLSDPEERDPAAGAADLRPRRGSKIFMVAIGVFFPVVINATTGVREIDQHLSRRRPEFQGQPLEHVLDHRAARRAAGDHDRLQARHRHRAGADRDRRDGRRQERPRLLIWSAWETFAVEQMYVGLFMIALIGFVFTVALNELERIIIPWKAS